MPEQDYLAELIKKVKAEKKKKEQEQKKPAASLGEELEKSFRAGEDEIAPSEETMKALREIAGKETVAEESGAAAIEAEAKGSEAIGAVVAERGAAEEAPEKSDVEKEIERAAQKKEITAYGDVKIYQIPGKPLLYYYVPVARPKKAEKTIISTIKEAATRLITISPYRIREPEQRKAVYKQKILEILRNSPELHIPERRFEFYAECVVREMVGYGIIDPLVTDDNLEEIMVIGPKKPVYLFHREYEMMTSNIEFYSDQEVIDLINRIARQVGRRVDISSPLLDARLPDGSRVNATIAPASVEGATLTIRKFRKDPYSMVDLISLGTVSAEVAGFLWLCVEGMGAKPANILISGGTSSGKTTTLNCMASFIPERERIITIEDTAELNLPLKHWIRLEARPPGLEGKGELTLDILTKNSLRMRPDRIIVGEVRHDEAFTLFTALNTGHDGALRGDALVQLSNGNIVEIGCFVEKLFEGKAPTKEDEFEFVELSGKNEAPSLNKQTLKIENKKITRAWRKRTHEEMLKIRLKSGKQMCLTKDHPIYRIGNGVQEINAKDAAVGDFIAVPTQITVMAEEELMSPHLLGLIYGDGHLGREGIQFVNSENSLICAFQQEIGACSKNKVSRFDYGSFSRVQIFDKKLIRKINAEYEMPIGNKTKTFKLNEKTLSAKNSELASLLQGLFDCESHVNLQANCIQFSTSNKDLANKLPMLLMRFGIASSTYAQEKDGKGNIGPYYRISIYGKENLLKFQKEIGFKHEQKKGKMALLVEKSKGALDLFPNIERMIKNARADTKITQTELGTLLGATTGSSIRAYEAAIRNPTRKQLNKICELVKGETAKQLKILAESDVRFEQIISIQQELFDGFVYDLTVEDNHNYIANGVIVSNCMGTVHANSPQETIVRVTNPPMSVPEVMLSGLDIIIVEHKIHDKKRGTIRRITNISEVSGVLLRSPQTQTIFERDPVTDTIEKTNAPIKYLKILQDFTGLSRNKIEEEWRERTIFLQQLSARGIRGIAETKKATELFLLEGR